MLDVGRLRVLVAVTEHDGLPAAARALGTTAGDVAAQLSDLERELGLVLLDGDRPTPAGRRLTAHAGRLLAELEAAETDVAAVASRVGGVLRLGVGSAAGRTLLPDTLATLRRTAPDLDLRVVQLAQERASALGAERLDVVVIGEYAAAVPRRTDPDLERRELLTEPLLVAVPARHRLTGASVRLAELAGERWVVGAAGGDAVTALERVAAAAGFEPVVAAQVAEETLALALVAAGQGVAAVPASSVPVPVDGVRFVPAVDAGLRRTVTAVVRRSAAADPAVQRVLDALSQAAWRVAVAVSGVSAASVSPPAQPDGYGALGGQLGGGLRRPPAGPGRPARRPDPLSDPLPELGVAEPGPADVPRRREPAEPYANGNGTGDPHPAGAGEPPGRRPDPLADPYPTGASGLPARRPDPLPGPGGLAAGRPDPLADPHPSSAGGLPTPGPLADPYPTGGTALPGPRREMFGPRRDPLAGPPPAAAGDPQPRRRDPLADPRPSGAGGLPGRRPDQVADPQAGGGGGLPGRRPDPLADPRRPGDRPGRGGAYRAAGPDAPGGTRNGSSALPPPGVPTERVPRPRPVPGEPPGRVPPPDVAGPYPTSPDLSVRSLTSAELAGRRPEPPPGPGLPRRSAARDDAPLGTLPPAPPGSADDVRLSIFEDLRSEWFTRRDDAPATPAWESPADDGWRAAARLAEPTPTAGTTTSGLPRRKPQALYVPGAVGAGETPGPPAARSPQEVRGRLSSYREGVRRGRHAEQRPEDA